MSNNTNEYRGYSLFNEVEDAALRTWNRCTVLFNLNIDQGEGFVQGYSDSLNNVERMQMLAMYQYIAIKGVDAVRLEINRGDHSTCSEADKVPNLKVVH